MCGQASQAHLLPRSRIASHSALSRLPCRFLQEGTAKHERLARLALPHFAEAPVIVMLLRSMPTSRSAVCPPHASAAAPSLFHPLPHPKAFRPEQKAVVRPTAREHATAGAPPTQNLSPFIGPSPACNECNILRYLSSSQLGSHVSTVVQQQPCHRLVTLPNCPMQWGLLPLHNKPSAIMTTLCFCNSFLLDHGI